MFGKTLTLKLSKASSTSRPPPLCPAPISRRDAVVTSLRFDAGKPPPCPTSLLACCPALSSLHPCPPPCVVAPTPLLPTMARPRLSYSRSALPQHRLLVPASPCSPPTLLRWAPASACLPCSQENRKMVASHSPPPPLLSSSSPAVMLV